MVISRPGESASQLVARQKSRLAPGWARSQGRASSSTAGGPAAGPAQARGRTGAQADATASAQAAAAIPSALEMHIPACYAARYGTRASAETWRLILRPAADQWYAPLPLAMAEAGTVNDSAIGRPPDIANTGSGPLQAGRQGENRDQESDDNPTDCQDANLRGASLCPPRDIGSGRNPRPDLGSPTCQRPCDRPAKEARADHHKSEQHSRSHLITSPKLPLSRPI